MDIKPGEITDILKREIKDYDREIDVAETGTVLNAGDGIARVYGLDNALAGELVEFDGGLRGMVLNLEEDNVGVAIMGSGRGVKEGDLVRRTGRIIEVPVGEALLAPHLSYLSLLWPLREANRLCAMAHITGGGLVDNVPRVLGSCDAVIDTSTWEVPPLFRMIVEAAGIDRDEAYQALNMGIGMVLFVDDADRGAVESHLTTAGEDFVIIGHTEPATTDSGVVRWA